MKSSEIRQKFLDFFEKRQHKIVPSSPVVPFDDPTLLFTNAGMNQFKDVFLGQGSRDYSRAADTQKCIRVSGKHNDLEEVGHDTYHHTLFEMLGNWSFGDYYKKEAIVWAWELLTEIYKLPKERLWVTVYRTDEEALEYWKTETDINQNHILKFDEKDNFWEMGETGPCGPCSEIHINLTDDYDKPDLVNAGSPDCIELWNLVFIQYNRNKDGVLEELPSKHIDTGMGFERIVAVLQGKKSNYDTDLFFPIIQAVEEISQISYAGENQIPMRVIADHIRTLTFAIADGAIPGNEGRSYVLRRILRRALRYGRKLNLNEPFLYKLVEVVIKKAGDGMGKVFPELIEHRENIEKIIKAEEESFNQTLDRGLALFEEIVSEVEKTTKIISGEDVFKMYDTFGFPTDLIELLARERNLKVDIDKFTELMDEQKQKGRETTKKQISDAYDTSGIEKMFDFDLLPITKFLGYEDLTSKSTIVAVNNQENISYIVLDSTPFYAESGGQIDDKGEIICCDKTFEIIGLQKIKNIVVHIVKNEYQHQFENYQQVYAKVDEENRWHIMRNHSATHFLHAALRKYLGNHVKQSGSYVGADRLRFDFTHFQKVTEEEQLLIEKEINNAIRKNIQLTHHREIPFEEAKNMGAMMFFGDKYGDKVNVVQFGDYSLEFCGGTHVKNSSQINFFKIIHESSVASGIRRIEAVTGKGAEEYCAKEKEKLEQTLEKINELLEEKKKLEKLVAEFQIKEKLGGIDSVIKNSSKINEINVYKSEVNANSMDELKSFGDELREKMKNGIGLLISQIEDKVGIVCVVSDGLIKEKNYSAGKIIGEVAKVVGGGGGGRPHLATAGGKDVSKIKEAFSKFEEIISALK